MLSPYQKNAFKNLLKSNWSLANIFRLSMGTALALVTVLSIWNELSPVDCEQYDRMAHLEEVQALPVVSYPLTVEHCETYGKDFNEVRLTQQKRTQTPFLNQAKTNYFKSLTTGIPLIILKGTGDGLKEPASLMLFQSVARAFW